MSEHKRQCVARHQEDHIDFFLAVAFIAALANLTGCGRLLCKRPLASFHLKGVTLHRGFLAPDFLCFLSKVDV